MRKAVDEYRYRVKLVSNIDEERHYTDSEKGILRLYKSMFLSPGNPDPAYHGRQFGKKLLHQSKFTKYYRPLVGMTVYDREEGCSLRKADIVRILREANAKEYLGAFAEGFEPIRKSLPWMRGL